MSAYLYILRLQSGGLYIGCTQNLRKRYRDHLVGRGCRTTKSDPPVELIYHEPFASFSAARKREAQIKRWSRAKKEALVAGDLEKLKLPSKPKL